MQMKFNKKAESLILSQIFAFINKILSQILTFINNFMSRLWLKIILKYK